MGRGYSTYILGGLQALTAALILGMGLFPSFQKAWMENMHLRSHNYSLWLAMQPLPKMYNFDNENWYQHSKTDEDLDATYARLNHYPTRSATFGLQRFYLHAQESELDIFPRSRYRNTCLSSAYRLSTDQSSLRPRVLMYPIERPAELPGCP